MMIRLLAQKQSFQEGEASATVGLYRILAKPCDAAAQPPQTDHQRISRWNRAEYHLLCRAKTDVTV